jgi:fucose 4-O-acetylase-like acetyltransferase
MARLTPAEIDAQTPPDRNRFADLIRVLSIGVVVFGHWLVAVITVRDGRITGGLLIEALDWMRWVTWVVQVMPLFFFVGGYANAAGLASATARGQSSVDWLRSRARRLLRPAVPLLVFWIPPAAVLPRLGLAAELGRLATQVVLIPVWFLAAYLLVVAFAPLTYRLHRRFGVLALAGLVGAAALVDVLHQRGVPGIGWSNYLWVWAAVHQLGYFWFEKRLPRGAAIGLVIAAAGFGTLLALVHLAGYPVSMVGGGGLESGRSNNIPPAFVLVVLGIAQLGLVIALESRARRWLARPRAWAAVVMAGSLVMTVYLWHMTALVLAVALFHGTGLWTPPAAVDGVWWLTRPIWLGLLCVVLVPLVLAFSRFERTTPARPTTVEGRLGTLKAVGAVAAACAGLGLLVTGGLQSAGSLAFGLPLGPLALVGLGLVGLGVVGSRWTASRNRLDLP